MRLFNMASPGLLSLFICASGITHAAAPDSIRANEVNQMRDEVQRLQLNAQKSNLDLTAQKQIGVLAQSATGLTECYRQNAGGAADKSCTTEVGILAESWDNLATQLNAAYPKGEAPADIREQLALTQKNVTGVINSASPSAVPDDGVNATRRRWRNGDRDDGRWRRGHDRDDWRWRWRDRDDGYYRYPVYRDPYYRCYRDIFFRWYCPWN